MREYFTLHRSVFPSYLTIESGVGESYILYSYMTRLEICF